MRDPDQAIPRKRFGQHFLTDTYVIDSIVALAAPDVDQAVLEIGPGEGVLTAPLLAAGARLTAIEIDRDLAARLRSRFAHESRFTLHCADVLAFDFGTLPAQQVPWLVVGNLPYNISTPLILRLLEHASLFGTMTVMVQREVAERMAAPPGGRDYGRLSVMVQRRCAVSLALDIGPESFRPPPKVDSTVVQLRPYPTRPDPDFERWLAEIVRVAFSARRKTIANALRAYVDRTGLEQAGIDPGLRPEQIAVDSFVRLAESLRA